MSEVKLNRADFEFGFKNAPDFANLPKEHDPTDELYEFLGSAGDKNTLASDPSTYRFVEDTRLAEAGLRLTQITKAPRPCLGQFTHSTYKIDRFGEIYQADWSLYRINGQTKTVLKDYQDEGQSISPQDLGKVFKETEFTNAMTEFYHTYMELMLQFKKALENDLGPIPLDRDQNMELMVAIKRNDLTRIFTLLCQADFFVKHFDVMKKALRLQKYLLAGLTLAEENSAYKIKNFAKIKRDMRKNKDPFPDVWMQFGPRLTAKIKNRLTQPAVMNHLLSLIFKHNNYVKMTGMDQPQTLARSTKSAPSHIVEQNQTVSQPAFPESPLPVDESIPANSFVNPRDENVINPEIIQNNRMPVQESGTKQQASQIPQKIELSEEQIAYLDDIDNWSYNGSYDQPLTPSDRTILRQIRESRGLEDPIDYDPFTGLNMQSYTNAYTDTERRSLRNDLLYSLQELKVATHPDQLGAFDRKRFGIFKHDDFYVLMPFGLDEIERRDLLAYLIFTSPHKSIPANRAFRVISSAVASKRGSLRGIMQEPVPQNTPESIPLKKFEAGATNKDWDDLFE